MNDELRAAALALPYGPWWASGRWSRYSDTWVQGEVFSAGNRVMCMPVVHRELTEAEIEDPMLEPTTRYICLANPTAILALLYERDELRRRLGAR